MSSNRVLVVGGNLSGGLAALDLAHLGMEVYLAEKTPTLSGPDLHTLLEVYKNPDIKILTCTELVNLAGEKGNFQATLRKKPRYIDENLCNACKKCLEVCPVTIKDAQGIEYKPIKFFSEDTVPLSCIIEKRGTAPCRYSCPALLDVQGYVALIGAGRFEEALALIRKRNPLPGICGRICHRPCESKCSRKEKDEPIAIRHLKRFAADWEVENKRPLPEKIPITKSEKVAVIGSGPAGLTVAYDLVLKGYPVTVFDAHPTTGGMLTWAIPRFRLPEEIINYEIDYLKALGLEVKTEIRFGKDITFDTLSQDGYKAVFLGIGAQTGKKLAVTGEDADGVIDGLNFLRKVRTKEIETVNGKAVVIGGGNSAFDTARTLMRLGAEKVNIVYRRTGELMPADKNEIRDALEEGVEINYISSPVRIIKDENNKVTGVEFIKNKMGEPDKTGRKIPVPIEGSEFIIEADIVIPVIGQSVDLEGLPSEIITKQGTIKVDPETMATPKAGVFAAGDAVTGADTVLGAIATGHQAAFSIDCYLQGKELTKQPLNFLPEVKPENISQLLQTTETKKRIINPSLATEERITSFAEIEKPYTKEMAVEEAKRCLNCGICSECGQCEEICSEVKAVRHLQQEEELKLEVCSVILAEDNELLAQTEGICRAKEDFPLSGSSCVAGVMLDNVNALNKLKQKIATTNQQKFSTHPRIGVFICQCRDVIDSVLNTDLLKQFALQLHGVVYSDNPVHLCEEGALEKIASICKENNLNRIVFGSCLCCGFDQLCDSCSSRRVKAKKSIFQKLKTDSIAFEMVNLREHCAIVHKKSSNDATEKAKDLIKMSVTKSFLQKPSSVIPQEPLPEVSIIGKSYFSEKTAEILRQLPLKVTSAYYPLIEIKAGRNGYFFVVKDTDKKIFLQAGAVILDLNDSSVEEILTLLDLPQLKKKDDYSMESRLSGVFLLEKAEQEEGFTLASALAVKVAVWLSGKKEGLENPLAVVNEFLCRGCGKCEEVCQFRAVYLTEKDGKIAACVNELLCQGCGICASNCPTGAVSLTSYSQCQLEEMLKVVLA